MDLSLPGGDSRRGGDSFGCSRSAQGCAADSRPLNRAFAAILTDGSVVAWGDARYGGDSSAVGDQLKGVQQIQATDYGAFCCDYGR